MGAFEQVSVLEDLNGSVRLFILDEADKACDIEMENQIRSVGDSISCNTKIANKLPLSGTQTILCSATFPISVKRLINSCVENPITLRINSVDETKGGLSSDVTVHTIVVSSTSRFVRANDTSHS